MNDDKENAFENADLIHSYSRAQAIEDGVLVDVSDIAKEAGFRYPVALTSALWADIQNIPASRSHEDVQGRLWDALWMGLCAIKASKQGGTTLLYSLILPVRGRKNYTVKLICGPGDNAEPVITLMKPDED
jgi:hypothetical protein